MAVALSNREKEVAELLAWGAAKKEVADKLHISERTVENQARSIYNKLGIQKVSELCVWYFTNRFHISLLLSPVKQKFTAMILLAIFCVGELHDTFTFSRVRETRIERPRIRCIRKGTFIIEN